MAHHVAQHNLVCFVSHTKGLDTEKTTLRQRRRGGGRGKFAAQAWIQAHNLLMLSKQLSQNGHTISNRLVNLIIIMEIGTMSIFHTEW